METGKNPAVRPGKGICIVGDETAHRERGSNGMYRYKKVAFIRILDIWFDTERYRSARHPVKMLHSNDRLPQKAYDFSLTAKTFLLDIARDTDDIMAGFDAKSCRYCIRRAQKDGVRVWKACGDQEREIYLDFQSSFCREKGIPDVTREDIRDLDIYCAESQDGEFLGGCAFLLSADHRTVRYKYGATKHRLNANEAILWRAICDYHDAGYVCFDLGGCTPTEDKESYYYRHYHFKKKFGGTLEDSYTYVSVRGVYRACYLIFSLFLKLFFHGDANRLVVWLNKRGLIR